jgi:hypothetical protein
VTAHEAELAIDPLVDVAAFAEANRQTDDDRVGTERSVRLAAVGKEKHTASSVQRYAEVGLCAIRLDTHLERVWPSHRPSAERDPPAPKA